MNLKGAKILLNISGSENVSILGPILTIFWIATHPAKAQGDTEMWIISKIDQKLTSSVNSQNILHIFSTKLTSTVPLYDHHHHKAEEHKM